MSLRYSRFLFVTVLALLTISGSAAVAKVSLPAPPEPSYDATAQSQLSVNGTTPIVPGHKLPVGPLNSPALIGPAIECFNFDDNITANGGFVFIPPDPNCAAGLAYVVNTGNDYIEWRPKANPVDTPQFRSGLQSFFASTPGILNVSPFDPKVIYDQVRDRFIMVCLQETNPPLASRILVAISKTSDPNAGWWFSSINSTITIGASARYADYPSVGVDDDAAYICTNMFSAAGAYGGCRLWVINPGSSYAGPDGSLVTTIYDPYALSGATAYQTTTQIAHVYGPEPANLGTFLVSYSGLSDGTNEYIDIIRVDSPLGPIAFNFQQLFSGNIDNTAGAFPNAPQLGGTRLINTNDRRALSCVWRNNNLYMSATVLSFAAPNAGQTSAHWWRVDTVNLGSLTIADQGDIGGEDLGAGTYTYFPAVEVDCDGNMAVGFSASNAGIYCGAYYATRLAGDTPGTIGATYALALGTDYYVRTFSSSPTARNRWGDYSGISICPVDQSTFWVYNEYACTQGTPTTVSGVTEYGRWCTKLGKFFLKQTVAVAITSFSARAQDGAVEIRSTFRSDLGVQAVNVYRATGSGDLQLIDTVFGANGRNFLYTDKTVEAGKTYHYQIGAVDHDGEFRSPVADVTMLRVSASLAQNSPNPFNPTTSIRFSLPASEFVTISVYDASGRLVRTLVESVQTAGAHDIQWNGRDDAGSAVGSGVYFYRLTAGHYSESKKMVMLK
jgi:FlgD Ig-like domain